MKEILHIYTRVSSRAQQQDGTSLEEQEKAGKEYAKKNDFDFKMHAEGGASAGKEDLDGRPVLVDLLDEIKKGNVKHLYVWNTDRLSRNERTWTAIKYALYDHSVTLHTSGGKVDLTSAQDRLLFGLLQQISAYDNDLRRARSRLGKLNRVRNGGWLGGPAPFGYEIKNKNLVLNKDEYPWLQKIFEWYSKGKSTWFIKGELDKAGVQPRRKNGTWSLGSIQAILKNTHPIGFYTFTDKETGETVEVSCPSCVDVSVWNDVAKLRKKFLERKGQINRTEHFYLLRDFMFCGHCESPMGARYKPERTENFYYCPAKERQWVKGAIAEDQKWKRGRVCKMVRSLNRPKTDDLIWRTVVDAVSKSHYIKEGIKKEVLGLKFVDDDKAMKDVQLEQKNRKRLDKTLQRAIDAIAELEIEKRMNKIEPVMYRKVLKGLEQEKENLMREIEASNVRVEVRSTQKQWIDWLKAHKDKIAELEGRTDEERKAYLEGVINRIDVVLDDKNQHHLTVHFRMPIVDDQLVYRDPTRKASGYSIVAGHSELTVSGDLRGRAGRPPKHKPPSMGDQCVTENTTVGGYSTVTTLAPTGGYLCFALRVSTPGLWLGSYTPNQEALFQKVKDLRSQGLEYKKIADILNKSKQKSHRGTMFTGAHIHSILKKGLVREKRLNQEPQIEYLDFRMSK